MLQTIFATGYYLKAQLKRRHHSNLFLDLFFLSREIEHFETKYMITFLKEIEL